MFIIKIYFIIKNFRNKYIIKKSDLIVNILK